MNTVPIAGPKYDYPRLPKRGTRFWRHPNGEPLGEHAWYRNWKVAATSLGFKDVDLYGSTRHTSATDLSDEYTPEEIREYWTGHTTSRSFYRYMHVQEKKKQEMYAKARGQVVRELKKGGEK